MPYRRLPNSTPAVLRTLRTARDTYKNTEPADRLIGPELFAQLDDADDNSLLTRFGSEVNDVDRALAEQAPLTTDLSQKAARLTMFVSHFHQVLDLGITRSTFAAGARSYYGRDISSTALPDLSSYDDVQENADLIVSGEAARRTAEGPNHVPMSLPSAADVATLRGAFKTARAAAQQAMANTNKQEEEVSALYPEAQKLAVNICETVEFNVRNDPSDSSRRAKAEQWGVVYIYEDQAATPTPTPAPTPTAPQPHPTPSANPNA